jgi:glycosyltransferase involved in cell wall biosynthesis
VIAAIAVVIPARDEQRLIADCLDSIRRAARHPAVLALPVTVVVAADSCQDRTAPAARRHGAHVLKVDCRRAGAARALGTAHALDLVLAGHPALAVGQLWLAHTDADSQVPESWLADQLTHATAGADAVAGLVQIRDWGDHTPATAVRFLHHYDRRTRTLPNPVDAQRWPQRLHPHVHGANLGVRADAYLAVGGFPPLAVGEDQALVTALEQASYRVHASSDAAVTTSARRDPRAPGGFGHFLLDLETRATKPQD